MLSGIKAIKASRAEMRFTRGSRKSIKSRRKVFYKCSTTQAGIGVDPTS